MEDIQWWDNLKNGNSKAFRHIYDMHADALVRYGKKFTDDQGLIEDCMHDLFVSLWRQRENLGQTDSIIKYLCVSLRRDLIRKLKQKQSKFSDISIENFPFDASLSAEDNMIMEESNTEKQNKLQQAFTTLSSRQKEAVYLRFYEEMNYEQICETMEINYQSVRNLISKAIIQLKLNIELILLIYSSTPFIF